MGKARKQKRIFKKPLTRAELEGYVAYGLSRELPAHQRLEFAKALHQGVDAGKGDLSYAQSLAKKAQGFLTPEDRKLTGNLSEKVMDLAGKAKLRYGRERITAAKAVSFIKEGWMREHTRDMLLIMLIDALIEIDGKSGHRTKEQYKEVETFFHDIVELNIYYKGEDDLGLGSEQLSEGRVATEEHVEDMFDLAVSCLPQYYQGMTAEEATKDIDSSKRFVVKKLLLGGHLYILFQEMVGKAITQEQCDEIHEYIRRLTSLYLEYTTHHMVASA